MTKTQHKYSFKAQETAMLSDLDKISRALKIKLEPDYLRAQPRQVGRVCYIPIEVASRELLSKSIIAKGLIEQGFQVVLGARWQLTHTKYLGLPPGVVIFKTLNALDAVNMRWAQEAGHIAISLDEELFPIRPRLKWYRAVTNQNALNIADMICAPGKRSKEMFEKITDANVEVTGNPRCNIPKVTLGQDILVCTMAGLTNSARGFHETILLICQLYNKPLKGDLLEYLREKVVHECASLSLLLEVVQELSIKFPNRRIRLRIHPSENRDIYGIGGNVVLDTSISFSDALQNTAVLVFVSGCSTGIEAFMAKVPAVRLGTGGHGLSCGLYLDANSSVEAVQAVEDQLCKPQLHGNVDEHFAPLTLPEKIIALQEKNNSGKVEHLGNAQFKLKENFAPDNAMQLKFPNTPDEHIADLTAARSVKSIGWNTWLLS